MEKLLMAILTVGLAFQCSASAQQNQTPSTPTKVTSSSTSSKRDLYVFFINGDGALSGTRSYQAHLCPKEQGLCNVSEFVKKDSSLVFFNKATALAKNCNNCDAIIIYTKPKKVTGMVMKYNGRGHGKTVEKWKTIHERLFIYRDGELKGQHDVKNSTNKNSTNFFPFLLLHLVMPGPAEHIATSGIRALLAPKLQNKKFSNKAQLFKETLGIKDNKTNSLKRKNKITRVSEKNVESRYRHQYAFWFGHKISDNNSKSQGSFHSSKKTKFSIKILLNGLSSFSQAVNRKAQPFDALFLAQCLSTIETIHQAYKLNAAKLVFASPEVVPLAGLAGLNLSSLGKQLSQSNPYSGHEPRSVKESIQEWMKKLFDPEAEENISEKIKTEYTLSLYDMKELRSIESDFLNAVKLVKKARKKFTKEEKNKKEKIAKGEIQNDPFALINSDCQKISESHNFAPFLEKLSQTTFHVTQQGVFKALLAPDAPPHSGWSCL